MKQSLKYKILGALSAVFLSNAPLMAQSTYSAPEAEFLSFNTDMLLMLVAIFLVIPLIALARVLYLQAELKFGKKSKVLSVLTLVGLFASSSAQASAFSQFNTTSWVLFSIILVELVAIAILAHHSIQLLGKHESLVSGKPVNGIASLWERLNKFRPIEEEGEIEMEHSYDGIKELDNATPPWFTIAFLGSIVIAFVYLWVYHVSKSAPMQIEEYNIEMAAAEAAHAEYLKIQPSIDENSVKLLTDAASIESGKKIFDANCVACHRNDGGGTIGPNLTDEFWLHGGSVKDVFSTIKYGVLDKGMVPWKDDLSPNQIAQVVAYIHSLKGTNPANAKAAEGEIYNEEEPVAAN
ncbi:MAG: c-type cytochrome [Chitinophagales bacterium]|nr:c-type cytochrome [Chitinophagales bacterium]